GRALQGEVDRRALRPCRPCLPRDDADPLYPGGARPRLPQDLLWSAARYLRARSAELSRTEWSGDGDRDDAAIAHPGRSADALVQARAHRIQGDLESDRL